MVAEHGAVLEGGMVGAASEHWACDALVAFDIALFVLPDRRGGIAAARLLKAFAAWCKEQGAVIATAGISTQVHRINLARFTALLASKKSARSSTCWGVNHVYRL